LFCRAGDHALRDFPEEKRGAAGEPFAKALKPETKWGLEGRTLLGKNNLERRKGRALREAVIAIEGASAGNRGEIPPERTCSGCGTILPTAERER